MTPSTTVPAAAPNRPWRRAVAALASVGLVAALGVSVMPPGNAVTTTSMRRQIASARAHNFRVILSAIKGRGSEIPSATVEIAALERSGSMWKRLGKLRVGRRDGFFWKVITRPGSIRHFSVGDAVPRRASVRLLVSPSIGWTRTFRFQVENGKLMRGSPTG